jgi:hypothetical protein
VTYSACDLHAEVLIGSVDFTLEVAVRQGHKFGIAQVDGDLPA